MTEDTPIAVGIRKVSKTARFAVVEVLERTMFFRTRAGTTINHKHRTTVTMRTLDRDNATIEAKRLSEVLGVPYVGEAVDQL